MTVNVEPMVTITAIVTRADGTVEDLGIVATNRKPRTNPIRRIIARIKGI